MKHIVALSGGKDSTAMSLRLNEIEPREYEYVCTPTGNELPEMVNHWLALEQRLGKKLKILSSGHSLGSLIEKWNALPNWRQRWCTRVLKIEPFLAYVSGQAPCVIYVGMRADETDRDGVEYNNDDAGISKRYPMVEWKWDEARVRSYLIEQGITIPRRTDCAACFFQTIPEWFRLWLDHPEDYAMAEAWERTTGHTFRSPSRDTWSASLSDLRSEFESGRRPLKRASMDDRRTMCSTCAR